MRFSNINIKVDVIEYLEQLWIQQTIRNDGFIFDAKY